MAEKIKHAGILTGALIGLLLTAPLIALIYLGQQLAGLPFLPFDLFDWLARVTPGALITFTIDRMVDLLTLLNVGDLSEAAKTSEQMMGVATVLLIGTILGGLYAFIMRRTQAGQSQYLIGMGLGFLFGLPLLLISNAVNFNATADPLLSLVWFITLFIGWGGSLAWIYSDISDLPLQRPENDALALNRRQFLVRVGGATATITLVGSSVASLLNQGDDDDTRQQIADAGTSNANANEGDNDPLPNADDPVQPAPGTRPEYTPLEDHYRIDINTTPPTLDGASWQLPVMGLVDNPTTFTLESLQNDFTQVSAYITMGCISNRIAGSLISTIKWTGVPMREILERVQPQAEAGALRIVAADGFDEYVRTDLLMSDDRIMLCYAWDDQPLLEKHGYPLRIHIPDRYGMKQPKWITEMEFVPEWEEGYWVRRGWSAEAQVKATSVIDTIATEQAFQNDAGTWLVPMGGIAWAGDRGISQVQVSVNDGPWLDAELRSPLSERTWVVWRLDWPFEEGRHTFRVRCVEGDGTPQIAENSGTRPDGATGLHGERENLRELPAMSNEA